MVYYSLDRDTRLRITSVLGMLALIIGGFINRSIEFDSFGVSALSVFGLLFWTFDSFLWKRPLLREIVGVPDLSGKWSGVMRRIQTSGDGSLVAESDVEVCLRVCQTWTRIGLQFVNFNESTISGTTQSATLAASLEIDGPAKILRDVFQFETGWGSCRYTLVDGEDGLSLVGVYLSEYSGGMRQGEFTVFRE